MNTDSSRRGVLAMEAAVQTTRRAQTEPASSAALRMRGWHRPRRPRQSRVQSSRGGCYLKHGAQPAGSWRQCIVAARSHCGPTQYQTRGSALDARSGLRSVSSAPIQRCQKRCDGGQCLGASWSWCLAWTGYQHTFQWEKPGGGRTARAMLPHKRWMPDLAADPGNWSYGRDAQTALLRVAHQDCRARAPL